MKVDVTNPEISIFLPVYNSEKYIVDCINSIKCQTKKDFEVVIVNDGSTDNSLRLIENNIDHRFTVYNLDHNYISSLNTGLSLCRGKYILRMDSDDLMYPERVQVQYDFMEANPQVDICGAFMKRIGNLVDNNEVQYPLSHPSIVSRLVLGNQMSNPTTILRKETISRKALQYSPEYIYAEDFKFWTDAVISGCRFANMDMVLHEYRYSDTQVTQTKTKLCDASAVKASYRYLEYVLNLLAESSFSEFQDRTIELKQRKLISANSFLSMISILFYEYSLLNEPEI